MKTRKKRVGITNKKRFTMFLLSLLVMVCCGFSSVKKYAADENVSEFISVFVTPGDTIWQIAVNNNPKNRDVRQLVYEIKKYNNLNSDTIHVGEELFIPTA